MACTAVPSVSLVRMFSQACLPFYLRCSSQLGSRCAIGATLLRALLYDTLFCPCLFFLCCVCRSFRCCSFDLFSRPSPSPFRILLQCKSFFSCRRRVGTASVGQRSCANSGLATPPLRGNSWANSSAISPSTWTAGLAWSVQYSSAAWHVHAAVPCGCSVHSAIECSSARYGEGQATIAKGNRPQYTRSWYHIYRPFACLRVACL